MSGRAAAADDRWMLHAADRALLGNKSGATRLAFAMLLKLFQAEGRFPRRPEVVRECLGSEVMLARSLSSGNAGDLAPLLREVEDATGVPVEGVLSDGQTSIRRAVAAALPGVPHQLCQFHFLREATNPIYEADRHAKKELKKQVRGVRPIERAAEGSENAEALAVRGYCAAVRSAITDDGRTSLAALGLKLKARLEAVADSLDRVEAKGGLSAPLARLRHLIGGGLERTAPLKPDVERAYAWVHAAARVLGNDKGEDAATVRRRFDGLVGAMRRRRNQAGALAPAIDHFIKVTRSYRPGLFHCCAVPGMPRTNNGLEQLFGSQRYHERRATGRRAASQAAVLRGEVRLIAATATRIRLPSGRELGRANRQAWNKLRQRLDQRRYARTLRTRFRRNPDAYLAELEQHICPITLPA